MQGDILDRILPTVGNTRPAGLPIWDSDQQMFLYDEYESDAGNRSHKGVRVTDRFMTVEYIGKYHTQTYINAIELYVYDGKMLKLAGKREYNKRHYQKEEIKLEFEDMFASFLKTQSIILKRPMNDLQLKTQAKSLVDSSYYALTEENVAHMLELAKPQIKAASKRYMEC